MPGTEIRPLWAVGADNRAIGADRRANGAGVRKFSLTVGNDRGPAPRETYERNVETTHKWKPVHVKTEVNVSYEVSGLRLSRDCVFFPNSDSGLQYCQCIPRAH